MILHGFYSQCSIRGLTKGSAGVTVAVLQPGVGVPGSSDT